METESKYLKKIRDVLRKKNSGSSSGTIYSGPNTKAKYLNDIAKEVDKLDISGGGSSYESPFFIVKTRTVGNKTVMVQTIAAVEEAIFNGKLIYLQVDNGLVPFKSNGPDTFVFMDENVTTDIFPQTISEEDNAIVIEKTRYYIWKSHDSELEVSPLTIYCKVDEVLKVSGPSN